MFFTGPDRLAAFERLSRLIRMGSPEVLAIPDRSKVLQELAAGRGEVRPRLGLYRRELTGMVRLLLEWCIEMPAALLRVGHAEAERDVTSDAFAQLIEGTALATPAVKELLLPLFDPASLDPLGSRRLRAAYADGRRGVLEPILASVEAQLAAVEAAVADCTPAIAAEAFSRCWDFGVELHDVGVEYAHAYPSVVLGRLGQPAALDVIRESFSGASFFEPLWQAAALPPPELAAFLAEHLRAHFSGDGRGGSVQVVEERDRYRLVLDPCGSGGALRRRAAARGKGLKTLPQAAPATWDRAGQVPAYCAHCAFNELESVRRFGFPILITEFDPDPAQPCGWTIYKTPEQVPIDRFTRLGVRREPERFSPPR